MTGGVGKEGERALVGANPGEEQVALGDAINECLVELGVVSAKGKEFLVLEVLHHGEISADFVRCADNIGLDDMMNGLGFRRDLPFWVDERGKILRTQTSMQRNTGEFYKSIDLRIYAGGFSIKNYDVGHCWTSEKSRE